MANHWLAAVVSVCGFALCGQAEATCVDAPDAYLAMSYEDFDQGVAVSANGGPRREWGWREIARKPGCTIAAADLIRDYRVTNEARLNLGQLEFLKFHEGQMAASGGDVQRAISLIEDGADCCEGEAWRLYSQAIMSFLRGDREALMGARARLLKLPEPENWPDTQAHFREHFGQEMRWPMNIEATDALVECFGRRYPGGIPEGCGLDGPSGRGLEQGGDGG